MTAYLSIEPQLNQFSSALDGLLAPITSKFEGRFGKFGKAATLGLGAIVVGGAAAGKALYDIGEQFDSAYDTIQTGTGATGRQLDVLKDDFRDVVKSVPTDFGSASQAITQLNQRLGVTGKPLRDLSKQMLELSRITDTDLDANIQAVTRTFGDWGIKVRQQPAFLDKMFRASQQTGISVADLGQQMVRYGAPLRQMGFGFSEAAAMVGKFEKEGVNAQLVMGSLRIALGKMATEGVEDPAEALGILTERIKNAGSAGEANKLALETFGARAGPDMAAAIREGRFAFDDLVKGIDGGKQTIIGTGRATMDFGERLTLLKNKAFVALEPIATRVFDAIGTGMLKVVKLFEGKGSLAASLQKIRSDLAPLISIFGFLFNIAKSQLAGIVQVFKGAFQIIGGVVKVFTALLRGDFGAAWAGIKQIVSGALNIILGRLNTMIAPFRGAAGKIVDGITAAFNFLKNLAGRVAGFMATAAGKLVVGLFKTRAELIAKAIVAAFNFVKNLAGKVAGFLADTAQRVASFGGSFLEKAKALGEKIVTGFTGAVGKLPGAVKSAFGSIGGLAGDIGRMIADWINDNTPFGDTIHIDLPGPKNVDIRLPALAAGTDWFPGGLAVVGEQGPELAYLPRGAAVADAKRTRALLSGRGMRRSVGVEGGGGDRVQNIEFNVETQGSGNPDTGLFFAQVDARLKALA